MARKAAVRYIGTGDGVGGVDGTELLKEQILDLKKQVLTLTGGMESLQGDIANQPAADSLQATADSLQNCLDQQDIFLAKLDTLSQTVFVLTNYVKTFNNFLCNSMISNNADKAAEDSLTEVLSGLPD